VDNTYFDTTNGIKTSTLNCSLTVQNNKLMIFKTDSTTEGKTTYEYNADGNPIKANEYNVDDTTIETNYTFTYVNGKRTGIKTSNPSSASPSYEYLTYTYNTSGKISEIDYYSDAIYKTKTEYYSFIYDSNGNLNQASYYDKDSNRKYYSVFTWEKSNASFDLNLIFTLN